MKNILERLKQKHVIATLALLAYQGFEHYGYGIRFELFQTIMDVATYVLLGYTVFKSEKDSFI